MQEQAGQLRCLKIAVEARINVPLQVTLPVIDLLNEHAAYTICRGLKGSDGRTPFMRLKGHDTSRPMIEYGEQVLAKPMRTKAWSKRSALEPRWVEGTWVGINARTGEHLVVLTGGETLLRGTR